MAWPLAAAKFARPSFWAPACPSYLCAGKLTARRVPESRPRYTRCSYVARNSKHPYLQRAFGPTPPRAFSFVYVGHPCQRCVLVYLPLCMQGIPASAVFMYIFLCACRTSLPVLCSCLPLCIQDIPASAVFMLSFVHTGHPC